jgi:hypothetical protein
MEKTIGECRDCDHFVSMTPCCSLNHLEWINGVFNGCDFGCWNFKQKAWKKIVRELRTKSKLQKSKNPSRRRSDYATKG